MAEEGAGKLINTHDGAASSSSSTTPQGSEYQVFLNFRGEDTRKNFTDHLYCNLTAAGIRTFRDNEGLRIGEKIGPDLLKAIERSTISIPIFSKGYASSKWCLMELTQMVKCMKTNNGRHTICPIFYGVTPANVKHQTGSFEEAFLKHAKDEVNERTIQEWKDALKEVAELKGWEKDKIADGLEGELIKIIVTQLCTKLKKSYVILPDNLVGMDHHREQMTTLLDISSGSGVRIVGILGMGGLGKTTIAKFMYNQLCDHFQRQCSFLEDVWENVERNGCAKLQEQLVSDVLKRPADEIPVHISNAFRDKKVLIVLDDVKDRLQFDEIIRSRDWFGSGSRIIVTSRNQDVSVECEVLYRPTEKNFDDSLLLFSKHAFKSPQPREDYQDISRQLVLAAAGLPLYLKVIGSMLFEKEKPIWEETLKNLEVIPPNEVQRRLKISYDALDYGKKQIFLDIACHFIGKDKTLPFYMWDACEFLPEAGINALVSLSLITIEKIPYEDGEENIFRMHDHLRDLGRNIVRQENPNDVGKRSRLWSRKEAEDVLNNGSGTRIVETLYMENSGHRIISNDDLKGLSNLRYLHLDSLTLEGDFKGRVSNLRWFAAPLKNFRTVNNFCANKLAILDLSGSEIWNAWDSWIQIKDAATNLKVLNLSFCRYLTKLPECLWSMKLLVELDLSGTGIRELSEQGIGNLTNLTKLLLGGSKINMLPDAMGKLEKLEVLDCSWCSSLEGEVPEEIWRLSSLRLLKLNRTKLTGALPKDISGMSRLETLDLGSCVKLRLPTQGLKLPISLTKLVLPFTKTALDSDSLRSLVNLRHLEFSGNAGCCCEPAAGVVVDHHNNNNNNNNNGTPLLPIIIDMPSNLEFLTLRGFHNHKKIKSCRLLPAMKFDSSSRLHTLQIWGFKDALFSGSIDLSNCQMLRELRIMNCNKMREIAGFGNSLGSFWVSIRIVDCDSLEVLPNFSTLKRLKTLRIMECPKLREIKGLEEVLTSLEELTIRGCPLLKKDELHPDLLTSETLKITFEHQHLQLQPNKAMAEVGAGKLINTHDASSSSSTTPQGSEYQVFLNFRGEDTRKNFTDHLYCNLTAAGIRTFRDNEGLRTGEEIGRDLLKAIERSTISIPIFSEGYASSKWCLIELTHMVKCMKTNNGRHTICPIFYGVTPANVKHQTGSFQEAFLKHAKDEVDECTIQEWKDALKEVAELKGWEKDKIADGLEGELIEIIVTELCMKLKKSYVSLPDNLVGMDHHIEEMTKLLDISSGSGVRIVGILGMGGIGKTTIAKFMYNQLCDHFQHQCSFLGDVRENVERKGIAELQKQLIPDVLKRPADGIALDIRNALRHKKVLIVLDDVKDRLQFDEIIRSRDWFGSGSRIIVTTRNKEVFEEREGDIIYKPSGMSDDESLLLFCKHAFKSTQPSEGYEDISKQLVLTAAGLPLSLKVIGSMLYKKKKAMWEETLKKLKVIPHKNVEERLKISYDALEYVQQQIFLDIACHFIGKDKTLPFYMWDACKFFPESGIDALVSLSLITIEKITYGDREGNLFTITYGDREENIFRMHDHLRDLGRKIVIEENRSDLGKRSRLWSREKAEKVLNNGSGTRIVETLYMENSSHRIISNDDLKGLSNLRYLHLENSLTLEGDFKGRVSNLRWFAAPLKNSRTVNNFCANKLAILDLSGSEISNGWESWIQIQDAATNLKVLNLSNCRKLTRLPECLWNMKLLVELDISETGIRVLSEQGIGNLTNLRKLLLGGSKIKRLPDAMGKLEKLEVLDCSSCWSMEGEVPEEIWRLSSLRHLNLNRTELTALPKDISGMSRLETLDLGHCMQLRLPTQGLKLPISLTRLVLPFTKTALDSDSLRSLVNLRCLRFDGNAGCCCEPAAGVVDHRNNNNNNNGTELLPVIIDMPSNLESLILRGYRDHKKIKSCRLLPAMKFDSSSRLDTLEIYGFEDALLSGSIDLSNCQMLQRLVIMGCFKMREIPGFGHSLGSSWVSIQISLCDSLEVLPNFSTLKRLKTLEIGWCPKLREIKGLEEVLTSLKALTIEYCPLLKEDELHPDVLTSESLKITFEQFQGLGERLLFNALMPMSRFAFYLLES